MRIIIVGGGKVGCSLARQLRDEGHEITVIDTSEEVIHHIGNTMDVIGCVGNGVAYSVLKTGGADSCDLLIAVTATDEVNMLCCLAAHKLGAKHTIARVRNPEYREQLDALKDDLGLSMAINPERATAEEIARILRFPAATRVELFARGRVELVSCKISAGNILDNLKLQDLPRVVGAKVLICAVSRNDEVTIPSGSFVLKADDELCLTGSPQEIEKTFRKAGMLTSRARSVIIAGGSRIAYYLAQSLLDEGIHVKIIEVDSEKALSLAASLPKAAVLCGDVSDHELLDEEDLERQDAFISLTGLDEGNVLSALYASSKRVPKVIAKVNNESLTELVEDIGLQTIITPKRVTSDQILCYVRALAARKPSENVLSLYKLFDGRAEALEFRADSNNDALLNIPLMKLKTKSDILIACLVRNGRVIIPGGADCILSGDRVLVVTARRRLSELNDILED